MTRRPDQVEQFSLTDLANLRSNLIHASIDNRQAAEILTLFLMGRGYGVDSEKVPEAVIRLERLAASPESMQAEIERVAMVM